jgi:hypothetical protein
MLAVRRDGSVAKRRNAAEREQESETKHMQDLFAAGLIEAGEGVISFGNDSLTTTADLRGDGFITCKVKVPIGGNVVGSFQLLAICQVSAACIGRYASRLAYIHVQRLPIRQLT